MWVAAPRDRVVLCGLVFVEQSCPVPRHSVFADISDWQRLQAEVAEKRRRRDALRERVTAKLEAAIRERLQSNVAAQTTTVEDSTSEGEPIISSCSTESSHSACCPH